MKLDLTKQQSVSLVQLCYLAESMLAYVDPEREHEIMGMQEVIELVYETAAKDSEAASFMETDADGGVIPRESLTEDLDTLEDGHNNMVCFTITLNQLVQRDIVNERGEAAVSEMDTDEYLEATKPYMERYVKRMEEDGLSALFIPTPEV